MRLVFIGPFGLRPKRTMADRALPLAQALAQHGHTVRMILPPWNAPEDSGKTLTLGGVEVAHVKLPPRWPLLFHLLLTLRLLRAALNARADVIHVFKPKAHAGFALFALWLMRGLRLTRVRLVADEDDWEGAGGWNEREAYPAFAKRLFAWQEAQSVKPV